jgi:hypothetical protein
MWSSDALSQQEPLSGRGISVMTDWRVPDQAFWMQWRADKVAMKAAGYRVTRDDYGQWLVSFTPVTKLPSGEAEGARDLQTWAHRRIVEKANNK